VWEHEEVGRVHLALSGTLLETLADPRFQARVYGIVDCGSLLWHLQSTRTIDVLGTAYYHPVLRLRPRGADRSVAWPWPPPVLAQPVPRLLAARARVLHGSRAPLARHGYEWVIVDSEHVRPLTPMSWEELRYRPHCMRVDDAELIVVVRDRDLSNAQESGMEPAG
jgi:4-alpha-glucanotransferase